jgi:hypothetical protein
MQQHDCLELQRKARRSGRLRPNALLLLAEICDLHGCEKGCIASNDTFAENLGATTRSVRNWLSELKEHGFIAEAQQGPNRLLIPRMPGWMQEKDDSTAENSFQGDGQSSGKGVPERKEDSTEGGKDFPPQRDNNHESGSTRPRGDRWGFLPDYRQRHLPEIKQEAGSSEDTVDVLGIASRYLGRPQDDLAGTVDWHLDQLPEDQVIAAYVIAGREADSPPEYADKIIREGWKEPAGGDGVSPQLPDSDDNVIHFGNA